MHRRTPLPLAALARQALVAAATVVSTFFLASALRAAPVVDVQVAGLREDATLRDVAFLNAEDGWAVGDAGTVLRTNDGGQTWTVVDVDSAAMLTGVAFADRDRGLIVGWKLSPYTHRVSAEVLSTADGGNTWLRQTNDSQSPTALAARLLPGFLGIFSGSTELTAFGHVNLHARTGLAPWSGPTLGFRREGVDRRTPIAAATRADAGTWLFAKTDGTLQRVRDRALETVAFEAAFRPAVRALAEDGSLVVAAGSDAFVAVSSDSGASFRVVDSLPEELRTFVHWKTAAVHGSSIWLAGSPGSVVANSEDGGDSWQVVSASEALPIEKIAFLDRSRGWAVGALGTIRLTVDGGRTWSTVRGAGRAAGLATFAASPDQTPFEPMAKHATVDGYRATTWILADVDDEAAWSGATAGSRLAYACSVAGGGAVENVTGETVAPGALEDPGTMLARSDAAGGPSERAVVARLASRIRAWQPEVLVVPTPNSLGGTPAEEQAYRLVLAALDQAADPQFEYATMRKLGLQPWRPKRVASSCDLPDATLRADGADYVAPAKMSAVEFALALRAYVDQEPSRVWKDETRFVEIRRSVPGRGGSELFADVAATPGSARKRQRSAPSAEKLREHTESLPWRRSFQTLAHPETQGEGFVIRFEDAVRRTANLDPGSAGAALHSTGCLASARGRDDLADAAWRTLISRDPQGLYAEYAALRLATTVASAEVSAAVARAAERRAEEAKSSSNSPLPGVESFELPKEKRTLDGESVYADEMAYQGVELQPGAFAFGPVPTSTAQAIAEAEIGVAPAGEVDDPLARLDALNRAAPWTLAWPRPHFLAWRVGQSRGVASPGTNPTQLAAGLPPALAAYVQASDAGSGESFVRIVRLVEKPFLDGRADEPAWRDATVFVGRAGDRAAIALDDEYLYIAYRSPRSGAAKSAPGARRSVRAARDAELSGSERLATVIDVDGDATTALRFEVDRFGRCRESLAGDDDWNPVWYAAAAEDETGWCVEIAIPRTNQWAGPTPGPIVAAIGLYRVAPGEGTFDALTGLPAADSHLPLRRTLWQGDVVAAEVSTILDSGTETASEDLPSDDGDAPASRRPATREDRVAERFERAIGGTPLPRRLPPAP